MKKERLTFAEMDFIKYDCQYWVKLLSQDDTHLNKCMMVIFVELMNRVEIKMVGMVKKQGYLFKLKPYEREAILYMRNELRSEPFNDNAIVRLLKQNN
jgi:hypothetical protein